MPAELDQLNFMDKTSPAKEDSPEHTRELLIAISDSVPAKAVDSSPVHKSPDTPDGTEVTKENIADKLRSDLISISYVPSSEPIALPTPGAQEG